MKNYQFYHTYPLGMLNQLEDNGQPKYQLDYIEGFIPHLKSINTNGLLIGPLFESEYHGYDTIDYKKIDQRLGNNEMFTKLVDSCHQAGIDVIVDCVFNHVSRSFFAFQDVLDHREHSKYKDWFYIDFGRNNDRNDGMFYEAWAGHDELVKLNLQHHEVRNYLFDVAKFWMDEFHIDGLRLDASDVMDNQFIKALKQAMTHHGGREIYVVGEMVHGDYAGKLSGTGIESVTNYEGYKGLYNSLNDDNYFEIGYSLKRLFGNGSEAGLIQDRLLYNFVDNHDVNRVASSLNKEEHLYPLYLMLYTMKGYPSVYYKSEVGAKGCRTNESDLQLRPPYRLHEIEEQHPLLNHIRKLSEIRANHPVLCDGNYEEVIINHQLIGYRREKDTQGLLVLINSSNQPVKISGEELMKIRHSYLKKGQLQMEKYDLLNNEVINLDREVIIHSNWGRIIA